MQPSKINKCLEKRVTVMKKRNKVRCWEFKNTPPKMVICLHTRFKLLYTEISPLSGIIFYMKSDFGLPGGTVDKNSANSGTRVWTLTRKDSPRRRATEPMRHNYWALTRKDSPRRRAAESMRHNHQARVLQPRVCEPRALKPVRPGPGLCNHDGEWPLLAETRESPCKSNENHAAKKKFYYIRIILHTILRRRARQRMRW